ncbi:hypothetical protein B0H14DRAFT_2589848 [Mycena olivaceomarginata]|nr:hypothetical protein B0H14DRAFT_2589848 [Mycena olivaceomarginata]
MHQTPGMPRNKKSSLLRHVYPLPTPASVPGAFAPTPAPPPAPALIQPALDNSLDTGDTHQYLQKHLSQIVVDGRIGKKSIALVLTGIDIPFDEKGVEIDLATDITKLTTQIKVLKKRIENAQMEGFGARLRSIHNKPPEPK